MTYPVEKYYSLTFNIINQYTFKRSILLPEPRLWIRLDFRTSVQSSETKDILRKTMFSYYSDVQELWFNYFKEKSYYDWHLHLHSSHLSNSCLIKFWKITVWSDRLASIICSTCSNGSFRVLIVCFEMFEDLEDDFAPDAVSDQDQLAVQRNKLVDEIL